MTIKSRVSMLAAAGKSLIRVMHRSVRSKPTVKVLPNCSGCGVHTQTINEHEVGYLPPEAAAKFNSGWARSMKSPKGSFIEPVEVVSEAAKISGSRKIEKSVRLICQRCYKLQHYRRACAVSLRPTSVENRENFIRGILRRIPDEALVISVVDVLHFESSIVPELYHSLATRRIPVITVLNKLDCLPIKQIEWKSIIQWSLKCSLILRKAVGSDCQVNVVPVSSSTEEGFELLENRLSKYISNETPRPLYVLGSVNSGKSSFVVRLMHYIGFKHMGCVLYKRKVGGITRSPVPGTTQDFIRIPVAPGMDVYDTPGIPSLGRIESHLSSSKDHYDVGSGKSFQPVSHSLKEGKTLFIGSMCRVEIASGKSAILTCFLSPDVTLHICNQNRAVDFLNRKAGTFLYPPHSDQSGNKPSILMKAWRKHRIRVFSGPSVSHDDISIAGVGWISINGSGHKEFDIWVPEGVQVFRRPAMLPNQIRLHGSSVFSHRRRARGLRMNRGKRKLLQSLREEGKREVWRKATSREQQTFTAAQDPFIEELNRPERPLAESAAIEGYCVIDEKVEI